MKPRDTCDLICVIGIVSCSAIVLFGEFANDLFESIILIPIIGIPYAILMANRSNSATELLSTLRNLVAIVISFFGIYAYYTEVFVSPRNNIGWTFIGVTFYQFIFVIVAIIVLSIIPSPDKKDQAEPQNGDEKTKKDIDETI